MSHVIVVRGLGKEYQLGAADGLLQYELLRDKIAAAARGIAITLRGRWERGSPPQRFWALKGVDLDVAPGQVVGVIGRNGAGKSTFLKILSRITKPTEGYAELFGRVGSLLEVGTGFHPELTGRENIYLNGAILGMRRVEIRRSFDAIVDFSGVAPFLDTPVKRYSSGMYVRLAFAVAAHLETEILLVDEVLAVGDAEFQRKCLGKMQSVVNEGRTVLFVSHNMAAVKSLCTRAVWLERGQVAHDGDVEDVVDAYLADAVPASAQGRISAGAVRSGTGEARFTAVFVAAADGERRAELYLGESIHIDLELEVSASIQDAVLEVGVSALDGTRVATMFSVDGGRQPLALEAGLWQARIEIAATLLPRAYTLDIAVHRASYGATVDAVERVAMFDVLNTSRSGNDTHFPSHTRGYFRPATLWHVSPAMSERRGAGDGAQTHKGID